MGGAKIRIQHYVPKFYLRNFANRRASDYVTNCFDKTSRRVFQVSIENVAAESYFYDTDTYANQLVEKSLGQHESDFNAAYQKLLKVRNFRVLKKREKEALLFFVSSQEVRTREMRENLTDMIEQIYQRLSAMRPSENLRRELEEARTAASIKDLHVSVLLEHVPKLVAIMGRMKWVLMLNRTSIPFWTSDHPVNRFNPIDHKPYGSLGLVKQGINVYFPLSPDLVLCFLDPITYRMLPDKVELTDTEEVVFQNHLQVNFSTRDLFSVSDDFSLAKKMITENPELSNMKRRRHEIR